MCDYTLILLTGSREAGKLGVEKSESFEPDRPSTDNYLLGD